MTVIDKKQPILPWPANQGLSLIWLSRHTLDNTQLDLIHQMHGEDICIINHNIRFLNANDFLKQLLCYQSKGQLPYVVIKLNWFWAAINQDINLGWFDRDYYDPISYRAQAIHCFVSSRHYKL